MSRSINRPSRRHCPFYFRPPLSIIYSGFATSVAFREVLMSGRRKSASAAFSLVELLVVIGIIAILIALLIPSLSKAREQASKTRCQNNVRQIGFALAVYLNDNGDYPELDSTGVVSAPDPDSPPPPPPAYLAARRSGLLALRRQVEFRLSNLSCPEGWASGGYYDFYDEPRMVLAPTVYMDYAYWPWRF